MSPIPHRSNRAVTIARRAAGFSGLWLILTGGSFGHAPLAVAVIILATSASVWLQPEPARWSPAGLARFIPFFLAQSARGGLDVAWRALSPAGRVSPGWLDYRLRVPDGPARSLFAASVGLLPGTLTAALTHDVLSVHVLDRSQPVEPTLRALEERTAALFGIRLEPGADRWGADPESR